METIFPNYSLIIISFVFLGDNVKFMWHDSDGKTFGHQKIEDNGIKFDTDWFSHSQHSWSARVAVNEIKPSNEYSFIFYFAIQVIFIKF